MKQTLTRYLLLNCSVSFNNDRTYWYRRSFLLLTHMKKFLRTMRGTQGALLVASTIQIILGFSGLWRNVVKLVPKLLFPHICACIFFCKTGFTLTSTRRLLSPLAAVPLVSLVGFGLYELGFPGVSFSAPSQDLFVSMSLYHR